MYYLGRAYYYGNGVEADYIEAIKWFLKAVESGLENDNLFNILGDMYYKGQGAAIDYKEAAKWYLKAANKGNKDAMGNLISMYTLGKGVEKSYKKADEWRQKRDC